MKLKLDASGHVVLQDGKPVYIKDDGKEVAYDADEGSSRISALNAENTAFRLRATEAEAKAKAYEGIDVDLARKALDTVKNLDLKKLVDAGEVEKVKTEISKVFEAKFVKQDAELAKAKKDLHSEKIGNVFSRSKFITEKCAIPADMIQSRFGDRFAVNEAGQIVATDAAGNMIYSRRPETAGSIAAPDEALEILIDQYPYKSHVLKGTGASGGGAGPSGGAGGTGGKRTVLRSQFDALGPAEQAETAKDKGVTIIDG